MKATFEREGRVSLSLPQRRPHAHSHGTFQATYVVSCCSCLLKSSKPGTRSLSFTPNIENLHAGRSRGTHSMRKSYVYVRRRNLVPNVNRSRLAATWSQGFIHSATKQGTFHTQKLPFRGKTALVAATWPQGIHINFATQVVSTHRPS